MKIKSLILSLVMCVTAVGAAGCGNPDIVGDNLIMQARENYENLDSAKIIMTNVDTGKNEQIFTFKYEGSTLTYSDWQLVDGVESSEYNNGEVDIVSRGDSTTRREKGESGFKSYTRSKKHIKTRDDMITYIPTAVTDAKMTRQNGKREITHIYDVEKVKPTVPEGTATGFAVRYLFDKDGKLEYFTETTIYEVDGTEKRIGYKTEITQKNKITKVENIIETTAENK